MHSTLALATLLWSAFPAFAEISSAPPLTFKASLVHQSVTFITHANIRAFDVKGEATELKGAIEVENQNLKTLTAEVPIEAITTHLSLRDKHMREMVFKTSDGQFPPLVFRSNKASCKDEGKKKICQLEGEFSIRGLFKPLTMQIAIESSGQDWIGRTDFSLKLSDYGIEPPSRLGIRVDNQIDVHVELKGKINGA